MAADELAAIAKVREDRLQRAAAMLGAHLLWREGADTSLEPEGATYPAGGEIFVITADELVDLGRELEGDKGPGLRALGRWFVATQPRPVRGRSRAERDRHALELLALEREIVGLEGRAVR